MKAVTDPDKPYLSESDFEKKHVESKERAIQNFNSIEKMGGVEYSSSNLFLEMVSYLFL